MRKMQRYRMRRLLSLLLAAALVCTLAACGIPARDPDRLTVVATLFPQYDFARNLTGDRADVSLLLDFGADAHSYDPTPADIVTIARADLFIYTGDGMELWAAKLLRSPDVARAIESGSLAVLDLSRYVEPICIHAHEEHEEHDEHGHDHGDADPHIWTSLSAADAMCVAIADALSAADPDGAAHYTARLAAYREKLSALRADFDALPTARDTCYFGGSFAFAYLFDELGLHHRSVFEGCASHAEPTAADIAAIVDEMRHSYGDAAARYVLYDTPTEEKTARTIAGLTGAAPLRLHAIHNISKAEFDAGGDYLSLMRQNLETLRKALS